MAKKKKIPQNLQIWIDARKRYQLSHAHVQMARELGLNPRKFGKLGNHKQEPWKLPLPQFIERLYFKSFGKTRPDEVVSIEERAKRLAAKKAARKAARQQTDASQAEESASSLTPEGSEDLFEASPAVDDSCPVVPLKHTEQQLP